MDQQEPLSICTQVDVKLDIYHKRPNSLKFRQWTRCLVNVEAIKCLPCFLRITITSIENKGAERDLESLDTPLIVSINVHDILINLATSRTKSYAYGLFWTHNRRKCYLYFALETEIECRRHMKWFKKAIKNLEIYRHALLEHRRISRGSVMRSNTINTGNTSQRLENIISNLGTLPLPPSSYITTRNADNVKNSASNDNISVHASYISAIYEEIRDINLSSRLSHSSIASGVYEEMKSYSLKYLDLPDDGGNMGIPPPLPPTPPPRKRINTVNNSLEILSDMPSNLNSNFDTKNVKLNRNRKLLNNLFMRSVHQNGANKDVNVKKLYDKDNFPTATNNCFATEKLKSTDKLDNLRILLEHTSISHPQPMALNTRYSFSSPDLSKINYLDDNEEQFYSREMAIETSKIVVSENEDDDKINVESIAHKIISHKENIATDVPSQSQIDMKNVNVKSRKLKKSDSLESLNISECLPIDFNFSACNDSYVNLVGSNGAVPSIRKYKGRDLIIQDDLNGYCAMAPIQTERIDSDLNKQTENGLTNIVYRENCIRSPISSGYSTASGGSMETNTKEHKEERFDVNLLKKNAKNNIDVEGLYDSLPKRTKPLPVIIDKKEESILYENMQGHSLSLELTSKSGKLPEHTHNKNVKQDQQPKEFVDNLYENLLVVKATEELEEKFLPKKIFSSTPTDSLVNTDSNNSTPHQDDEKISVGQKREKEKQYVYDENYYQTPKKPIVKIQNPYLSEKIKTECSSDQLQEIQESTISPGLGNSELLLTTKNSINDTSSEVTTARDDSLLNLKHLLKCKMMALERKENLYISSPLKIIEQRQKHLTNKELNAWHKINTQKMGLDKFNKDSQENSPLAAKIPKEQDFTVLGKNLQHLTMLQNIDFRFDDKDSKSKNLPPNNVIEKSTTSCQQKENYAVSRQESGMKKFLAAENEYEEQYRASKAAALLLQNYATITPKRILNQRVNYDSNHKSSKEVLTGLRNAISARNSPISGPSALISDSNNLPTKSSSASKGIANSMSRIKKFDLSAFKMKLNNVLQRNINQQSEV